MAHADTITIVASAAAAVPGGRAARRPPCPGDWSLTNAPLINRHFASIKVVGEAQAQRCVALQAQPDRIRSMTLFHWWPQRLHKRHVPKRK